MTNIRRFFAPNQLSIQTHVTHDRSPILVNHFTPLWDAIRSIQHAHNFELVAWVALPDHVHLLIDLKSANAISIARQFNLRFSAAYRSKYSLTDGRIWQNRFWDHVIRDEEDLKRHIEYIHYNPVKHGLATSAMDYDYSSFRSYVEQGLYDKEWGSTDVSFAEADFGE